MVEPSVIRIIKGRQLEFSSYHVPCAIGSNGLTSDKQEGDKSTPLGRFPLRAVLYRADKIEKPITQLPLHPIEKHDGWCDAPADKLYNKPVHLPYKASAEHLYRDDDIYDIIVILGYNDDPVIPGKGSAIFFHIARPDYSGTEGCVAVSLEHMLEILKSCRSNTIMEITD